MRDPIDLMMCERFAREKMSAMQQQIEQFVAQLNIELQRNPRATEPASQTSLMRVARAHAVPVVPKKD